MQRQPLLPVPRGPRIERTVGTPEHVDEVRHRSIASTHSDEPQDSCVLDCLCEAYILPTTRVTTGCTTEAIMVQVTRRELLKGAAALGAAAALPDPLLRRADAQTTQKRELIWAQGGDVSKFDPHFSTSSNDIRVSFNLFDNLTSRHPDGKLYPGLATEWKLTAPTTWTFQLRQGVKFHNGDPFSSSDVKASIERTYDPAAKTRVSTVFATIERIEAPDPGTVVFHTKKPDPLLPARLAFYGGQIVPEKYLKSVGPDTFNGKPVGTGPIRFVSWTKDDKA